MTSTRTQRSYLTPSGYQASPALSPAAPPTSRRKLRREERDRGGNVLPNGSGTGYGQTNGFGVTSNGTHGGGQLGPRIRDTLAEAKERRRGKRQGDGVLRRNMLVDGDGYAHDSEYVQFRTATPVHLQSRQSQNGHGDEDSASSSSDSSSEHSDSGFQSAPYTYQSTHRSASSTHHHYAAPLGSTASAIPGYLSPRPIQTSLVYGSDSLAVPRAPSPRRSSAEYAERPGYGATLASGAASLRAPSSYRERQTTASYQPPAPAFNPRPMDFTQTLRLPQSKAMSSDTQSLTESAAKLALGDTGGSGYNQYASTRPPRIEGTLVDAGVHGMKRSWDGFKLEMKFGAHKVGKKVSRKITNM